MGQWQWWGCCRWFSPWLWVRGCWGVYVVEMLGVCIGPWLDSQSLVHGGALTVGPWPWVWVHD